MLDYGYSGSNSAALFAAIPTELRRKYDIRLVPNHRPRGLLPSLRYIADLGRASVVASTHGYPKWNPRQRHVELWHGFPLKAMMRMDASERRAADADRSLDRVDLVCSYSALYSTLMNACMGLDGRRYVLTGAPRNDWLWGGDGQALLDRVLGSPTAGRRLVFFMPTYRRAIGGRIDGDPTRVNILGLPSFDAERFSNFLASRNIRFVAKLHPFEEKVFAKEGGIGANGGIELLTEQALGRERIELYRLLAAADVLVTDYSSVYFDLLLKDTPLLFLPVDLEAYRESRGFLLEPYDFWAPGPKARDQGSLEAELDRLLGDPSLYSRERATVRDIIHAYKDNESSARVWAAIIAMAEPRAANRRETPV